MASSGAGRDHWTHCQSILMAGGGVRGGQTYGSSDRLGEYPSEYPLSPADIAKTVYFATGIDDLQAKDAEGRKYNLLDDGNPITAVCSSWTVPLINEDLVFYWSMQSK